MPDNTIDVERQTKFQELDSEATTLESQIALRDERIRLKQDIMLWALEQSVSCGWTELSTEIVDLCEEREASQMQLKSVLDRIEALQKRIKPKAKRKESEWVLVRTRRVKLSKAVEDEEEEILRDDCEGKYVMKPEEEIEEKMSDWPVWMRRGPERHARSHNDKS